MQKHGCHDLMEKAMSFNNILVVFVKGNYYRIHFRCMSKDETINIMKNSSIYKKKSRTL